jgi:acetyl esterase
MGKSNFLASLICFFLLHADTSFAQICGNRQLDPGIASFLKLIGYKDLSLEQLRAMPIEQLKYVEIPLIPYPAEDVKRIKFTPDSIPVLIFNPAHAKNLPIIIHYHGGGFISPLLHGLENRYGLDAKTYGAVVLPLITELLRKINSPLLSMIVIMHLSGLRHMQRHLEVIPAVSH